MPAKPKPGKQDKPKKRKKKTVRQILIRDLDKLVREIVFMRDPESAPLVYKEALDAQGAITYAVNHYGVPQPGHIISRKRMTVRWDLRNIHKQDASDNLLHNFFPDVYITWFIRQFGEPEWMKLQAESLKLWKYSIDDLEMLYIELVEISKKQEAEPFWKPYFSQSEIISGDWRK